MQIANAEPIVMHPRIAKTKVNAALFELGKRYHPSIPLADIDAILTRYGFQELEPAIYCGDQGVSHEPVGRGAYLRMTWYRMDSGRYEIVAYVS